VMCVAFGLIRFIPGDPVRLLLGELATDQNVREYRELLGLNGTMLEQFLAYSGGLLRGDLGRSIASRQPVSGTVGVTLPVTLWLIGVTVVMGITLALPLAVLAALHRRTWFGHAFRVVTSISLATPAFFSGLLAILFFSIFLGLAPVGRYDYAFPDNLRYLWLPALVICGVQVPILARVLQSSIVDTMEQEFVESAVVRGLPRRVFIWRYLLRPSLAPTIGLFGYMIGTMLGAAVIVEIIFDLPGIGTALITAVLARDYTVVQGIVLVFGFLVVLVSFVADTISAWIDPRTRTT
jgi:peptide/nickel transport system permease protein